MDNSLFSSQFQMTIYQILGRLLERYTGETGKTPQPFWITADTPGSSGGQSPTAFTALIQEAAARYRVDPKLISAVIRAESNFDPNAVSSAGAQGLMQLMPGTAAGLNVADPFNPEQNIDGGVRLLRQLLNRYDNDVRLALAAYNAGLGAVDRYGGIPPYRETQIYVSRVLDYLQSQNNWSA